MRNINARVPGLVSFLELITDGRAPDVLSGQVQAVLDYEKFVSIGKREWWEFQFDVPAASGQFRADLGPLGGATAVPNQEVWIVTDYSVNLTLPAGRLTTVVPTIWRNVLQGSGAGDLQPFAVGPAQSSLTTNVGGSGLTYLHAQAVGLPVLAPPRSQFGYDLLDWGGSGAGTLVLARLGFYRLKL